MFQIVVCIVGAIALTHFAMTGEEVEQELTEAREQSYLMENIR